MRVFDPDAITDRVPVVVVRLSICQRRGCPEYALQPVPHIVGGCAYHDSTHTTRFPTTVRLLG
jgi:hypothetical protein